MEPNIKVDQVKGDEEVLQAWVKELRSGSYEQASGTLHMGSNAFCCLGILGLAQGIQQSDLLNRPYLFGSTSLGNLNDLPSVLTKEEQRFFSRLNDACHLTFAQIALVVECLPRREWIREWTR